MLEIHSTATTTYYTYRQLLQELCGLALGAILDLYEE